MSTKDVIHFHHRPSDNFYGFFEGAGGNLMLAPGYPVITRSLHQSHPLSCPVGSQETTASSLGLTSASLPSFRGPRSPFSGQLVLSAHSQDLR